MGTMQQVHSEACVCCMHACMHAVPSRCTAALSHHGDSAAGLYRAAAANALHGTHAWCISGLSGLQCHHTVPQFRREIIAITAEELASAHAAKHCTDASMMLRPSRGQESTSISTQAAELAARPISMTRRPDDLPHHAPGCLTFIAHASICRVGTLIALLSNTRDLACSPMIHSLFHVFTRT